MTKLRLGPVAEEKPVKLTIELSGRLYRELSDYAAVHARETGLAKPLTPEHIAPPIIERFIAGDRGFASARKRQ